MTYTLYGTPTSYFTAKLRAYLAYKRIPFEEVMTTAAVYEQVVMKRTGVWMIPIVITPDDIALQNTTEIIDFLERRFPEDPVYPTTPKQRIASMMLEIFGAEWLIMTAIHYRWNKDENRAFAIEEFGQQALPGGSPEAQRAAGLTKAQVFGGWVDLFGIDATTGPKIEETYEALLAAPDHHFSRYPYFLGARPTIADFSFYGGMYAVLKRDPYSGRLMQRLAPQVAAWVERMHAAPRGGELLARDEVPETLVPVLQQATRDQYPVLKHTVRATAEWIARNPDSAIPKTIGPHEFQLRGASGRRMIYPYGQWMLQRALDSYAALEAPRKAALDPWVDAIGARDYLTTKISARVQRSHFTLQPEPRVGATT